MPGSTNLVLRLLTEVTGPVSSCNVCSVDFPSWYNVAVARVQALKIGKSFQSSLWYLTIAQTDYSITSMRLEAGSSAMLPRSTSRGETCPAALLHQPASIGKEAHYTPSRASSEQSGGSSAAPVDREASRYMYYQTHLGMKMSRVKRGLARSPITIYLGSKSSFRKKSIQEAYATGRRCQPLCVVCIKGCVKIHCRLTIRIQMNVDLRSRALHVLRG